MTKKIQADNVSFKYLHTGEAFLKDINLEVKAGECILICGPSGSGKTTFSRLLNGISPNYVEGYLNGRLETFGLLADESDIEEYVPIVGSVFQNPKTQHFTVNTSSELAFPLENMGKDPKFIRREIRKKALAFQVEHLLDRNMFNLSGGEKQQIAFVSANMTEPEVLILDEVTSNLDQEAINRIREMVSTLKARGMTIIIFEHRLAWTKGLVDRYVLFDEGKIAKEWSADAFSKLSNHSLNQLGLRSMDLTNHRKKIEQKKSITSQTKLKVKDLNIGYETHMILRNLNIGFEAGKIIGLLGPNGTGKSTLANTLTGLQPPISGEILWDGLKQTPEDLLKKSFLVMQDMNYQLFGDSVEEEIMLGAKHTNQLDRVIERLNLSKFKDRHPMSLSEGQKQRVAIASALLSGKEIIIFDEPTSGLDYDHMQRFGHLLNELRNSHTVIIVITHDEELAAEWCDSIIELKKE